MIDVERINRLHREAAARWHDGPIDEAQDGILGAVAAVHARNFRLWHEEDAARRDGATDEQVAEAKRRIDRLNAERHAYVEKLDRLLFERLSAEGAPAPPDAPQNTETPAGAIDRLSVLSLRIYHLEQICRDAEPGSAELGRAEAWLSACREQHADLSTALGRLLDDIRAGRKRFRPYRHLKMYGGPSSSG